MATTNTLSDAAIRKAKPGEKPRKLSDGGGLYLELQPNGGKWWRLKYRFEGKEKRIVPVSCQTSMDGQSRRSLTRAVSVENGQLIVAWS